VTLETCRLISVMLVDSCSAPAATEARRAFVGSFGGLRDLGRHAAQVIRPRHEGCHHAGDGGTEILQIAVHGRLPAFLRLAGAFPFLGKPHIVDRLLPEHLDGVGHPADLVGALAGGNMDVGIACGQPGHRICHAAHRPDDGARHQRRDRDREQRSDAAQHVLLQQRLRGFVGRGHPAGVEAFRQRLFRATDLLLHEVYVMPDLGPKDGVALHQRAGQLGETALVPIERRPSRCNCRQQGRGGELFQPGHGSFRVGGAVAEGVSQFPARGVDEARGVEAHAHDRRARVGGGAAIIGFAARSRRFG
jgi:hypothetical protein